MVGVWHYRYATSSPPAVLETHWHEWMPARFANVWTIDQGKWQGDRLTVNHCYRVSRFLSSISPRDVQRG